MTGASGVGKGTLRARLMERVRLYYSISMTTRKPREGERHGVDYWFVGEATFEQTKREGGFLEYASYVDHSYGTPAAPVKRALARGEDVLLEIEVQGALQVAEKVPEAQLIFVIPPSLSELRRRLLLRGKDSLEKIEKRLGRAREEIALADHFQYVVVNDVLEDAVADLERIILVRRRIVNRMRPALARALERDPDLEAELDEIATRINRR
jgi:guanylate kinase